MPHLTRRGLTLVELLVALVLLGIVTTGIYRVLVNNQRIYLAQTQRIDMQQNIRAGASILPAELRELNATDGDIRAMSATSITIRAMRQFALLCAQPVLGVGAPVLTIRANPFYSVRDFNTATDSILVYYEGDEGTRNDDGWVIGRITAIAAGACTDGAVGRTLTTNLAFAGGAIPQINQTGRIQNGSPLRGFTTVTYRLFQSATDSRWYLGYQEGASTQPLVGPLTANGLTLAYYDSTGAATAVPARVASIQFRLRAETGTAIRRSDGSVGRLVDSVSTWVSLRNNRRF